MPTDPTRSFEIGNPEARESDSAIADVLIGEHKVDGVALTELLEYSDALSALPVALDVLTVADFDAEVAVRAQDETPDVDTVSMREQLFPRHSGRLHTSFAAREDLAAPKVSRRYESIQEHTSKPFAYAAQASLDTIETNADYYSDFEIAPQADSGRGMVALAKAYVDRQRKRFKSGETVVWAYTHNGLEVRDFLAAVEEADPSGEVAASTRVVLACDSEAQKKAIEATADKEDALFRDWNVSCQLIDPEDPALLKMPKNVGLAIFADTLDKLPAHQVLKGRTKHQILEITESTQLDATQPLLTMNVRNGIGRVISASQLKMHQVAEDERRLRIAPQLSQKLGKPDLVARPLKYTDLSGVDHSTRLFVERQDAGLKDNGAVFNYVVELEALIRNATAGIQDDGLLYVSGPLRSTKMLPQNVLSNTAGTVVSNVIELSAINSGVKAADKDAKVEPYLNSEGGGYGYLVVDRSKDAQQVSKTREMFSDALKYSEQDPEFVRRQADLQEARQALAAADDDTNKASLADAIKLAYGQLIELYPQSGRDVALALDIAKQLNEAALYEDSIGFAKTAARSAPHLSAPLVEVAIAEAGSGSRQKARKVLTDAYWIGYRNPAVHKTVMDMMDTDLAYKNQHLPQYVEAASRYLYYAHDANVDTVTDTLEKISLALKQDYEDNQHDEQIFKTIIIEDLETGALRRHALSVAEMKRIKAADAALTNASTVGALRDYEDAENEILHASQERLLNIWADVVPLDDDGVPLPRDEWKDKPARRGERWIYTGTIDMSDEDSAPPAELLAKTYHQGELEPVTSDIRSEAYPLQPRTTLTVGHAASVGGKPAEAFRINKETMPGHIMITGQTRMGKTTLLTTMFEQLPDMGINFWGFDLGDKSELKDVADMLNAKGEKVIVIRPGDKNAIPGSIDILTPVEGCDIDAHIGKFVDAWITAYGGGGDSPVAPILSGALRDVYAANGWDVTPILRETLPTMVAAEPTTPSLQELLDACIKRSAEYGKGTNAGNLPVYFKKRIEAMMAGPFGDFLVGENAFDWEELNEANVIFDLSGITSHDQRRFLFTALTMQASNYLQFNKGLSKEVNTVWAVDEASLIVKDSGDGEDSRHESVEMYAERQKVIGGYGISVWNTMQSLDGVHPSIKSQKAVAMSLLMSYANDKREFLTSVGVREDSDTYRHLFTALTKGQPGTAIAWSVGMSEPQVINVDASDPPTAEQLAAAKQLRYRPPIKANPYDNFTYGQHSEALSIAKNVKQAWKQLFIGAVTISHIANISLPKTVPEQLLRQWKKEDYDPDFARLIVYYLAKMSVQERAPAVKRCYPPRELITSVVAHSMSLINGEATATHVSPRYSLESVRQTRTIQEFLAPRFGKMPRAERYADPLPYRLSRPVETVDRVSQRHKRSEKRASRFQTIADQTQALRQHFLSPLNRIEGPANKEAAYVGVIGDNNNGADFFKAMRYATGGEENPIVRRRLIATALGYLSSSYAPEESEFEEALALPTYLVTQQEVSLAA